MSTALNSFLELPEEHTQKHLTPTQEKTLTPTLPATTMDKDTIQQYTQCILTHTYILRCMCIRLYTGCKSEYLLSRCQKICPFCLQYESTPADQRRVNAEDLNRCALVCVCMCVCECVCASGICS